MADTHDNAGLMVRRFGPAAEVITLEDCPAPPPGPGQVRVRMRCAAINPSDLISISGAYRSRTSLPFVGGFEGLGVVEDLGAGVTGLRPGDRVLPLGSAGAWQQVKLTAADWCFAVPDALDDAQAATSYVNPMTAWLMLTEATRLTPDSRVAISAAGSVIGRMLVRLVNAQGLRPLVIVRRAASRDLLRGLSLEDVIVTDGGADCTAWLRAGWGGLGPTLALDAVGGATGQAMIDALSPGGTMLHYGLLSGRPLGQDRPLRRDVRFALFALRTWVHGQPRARVAEALAATARLVADGTLASPVAQRFDLAAYRDALAAQDRPGRDGKILFGLS